MTYSDYNEGIRNDNIVLKEISRNMVEEIYKKEKYEKEIKEIDIEKQKELEKNAKIGHNIYNYENYEEIKKEEFKFTALMFLVYELVILIFSGLLAFIPGAFNITFGMLSIVLAGSCVYKNINSLVPKAKMRKQINEGTYKIYDDKELSDEKIKQMNEKIKELKESLNTVNKKMQELEADKISLKSDIREKQEKLNNIMETLKQTEEFKILFETIEFNLSGDFDSLDHGTFTKKK